MGGFVVFSERGFGWVFVVRCRTFKLAYVSAAGNELVVESQGRGTGHVHILLLRHRPLEFVNVDDVILDEMHEVEVAREVDG